jgi:hypothetical protein
LSKRLFFLKNGKIFECGCCIDMRFSKKVSFDL